MRRYIASAIIFCNLISAVKASENQEQWESLKIFSMTFDADGEPEDLKTDAVVQKTVQLVKEQKPDVLTVRGSKHRVDAFVELTRTLEYNEGCGGSWSGSSTMGGSWISFHRSLKNKKGWHNMFGVIYLKDHDPMKYSVAFRNGSSTSDSRGEFTPLWLVKDIINGQVRCDHSNEDGSQLNFSAAIRIFTGRIGEADGLLNQNAFAFKKFQQDYFQNQHIPKEDCRPYVHGTRIIRLGVTEGSLLLTREELVDRGWYCDDIFCAGLDEVACIRTYIHPIFESNKPDVWGGMKYQPLVQQPIISQLTLF